MECKESLVSSACGENTGKLAFHILRLDAVRDMNKKPCIITRKSNYESEYSSRDQRATRDEHVNWFRSPGAETKDLWRPLCQWFMRCLYCAQSDPWFATGRQTKVTSRELKISNFFHRAIKSFNTCVEIACFFPSRLGLQPFSSDCFPHFMP